MCGGSIAGAVITQPQLALPSEAYLHLLPLTIGGMRVVARIDLAIVTGLVHLVHATRVLWRHLAATWSVSERG